MNIIFKEKGNKLFYIVLSFNNFKIRVNEINKDMLKNSKDTIIRYIQILLLFCHIDIYQFISLLIFLPISQLNMVNLFNFLNSIFLSNTNLQVKIIISINNR